MHEKFLEFGSFDHVAHALKSTELKNKVDTILAMLWNAKDFCDLT